MTLTGGCACGKLRYVLLATPLFVHCCHCRRCQRESGTAFVTHAVIERANVKLLKGETVAGRVPTDSRRRHEIVHCATCLTALWGQHGRQPSVLLYLKVGTLDDPALAPTCAHIFTRSKLPWVSLGDSTDRSVPSFDGYYSASKLWPEASLERYHRAKAGLESQGKRNVPV
jgi:hypothetical protein